MKLFPVLAPGLAALLLAGCLGGDPGRHQTFSNPILPSPSEDPWMIMDQGRYLYCESRDTVICLRSAARITDIGRDPGRVVWEAPRTGPCSQEIWAPELHRVGARWYIYFAADDGANAHHRMWVIASRDTSPFGPYDDPPRLLQTGGWSIDGTLLRDARDSLYCIWSGWPDTVDGMQQLYIARMSDPQTIAGTRILLTSPLEPWERYAMPICEGPEVLQRNGKTFIVYSASGSWTSHYCLGLLTNDDGNLLEPASWKKSGPVFRGEGNVYGVGHCSFVRSPDGREDWVIYHAKEHARDGWEDRSVRAQRLFWNAEGAPDFRRPAAPGEPLELPSE